MTVGGLVHDVGIIGGGISGLHLGCKLLDLGVAATIYHPQTADEIEHGPIVNSVVHQYDTIQREQSIGIAFWDQHNSRVGRGHDHSLNIPGMDPIRFWGSFQNYGRGVDYRMMLPKLMHEFEHRGGSLVHTTKTAADLADLQRAHDLVTIGVGRNASGFAGMFDEIPELSRHTAPARVICCGYYNGIAPNDPFGVTLSLSPVAGDLIVLPMETFDGPSFALLFELNPAGPAAHLADFDRHADPDGFLAAVLAVTEQFHPHVFERIDRSTFALHDEQALLQGAVRPVVRRSFAIGDSGVPVMAIGDLRVTLDPVTGAGANLGSYGAFTLAEHIAAHEDAFDVGFAQRYEDAVRRRTEATVNINDAVLAPPEHLVGLLMQMSQNRAMCDDFTEGFANPEHLWFDIVQDGSTAQAFAASFQ
ncbi:MAG: styrene monooxygenase/indole monooxygenase family protein [Ilumatobacteraceae bacterium]